MGLVIGKGGCTIKELEQRAGARVHITPDSAWQVRRPPGPAARQLHWPLHWPLGSCTFPALAH